MAEKLTRIKLLVAMLIGTMWHKADAVVEVTVDRAKREINRKNAEATDAKVTSKSAPVTQKPPAPTDATSSGDEQQDQTEPNELDGWPGDEAFAESGISTVQQVRDLIAEHGDAWPQQVKGIGKSKAAQIVEKLDELAAE